MTGKKTLPAEGQHAHRRDLRVFHGVEAWVFDLDNTLYPAEADLFTQINNQIASYVARLLGISQNEAQIRQKAYYHEYGTTLRGLMVEHKIDPDEFLRHAHDIDYSALKPNPELRKAIAELPGKKFIFTNGDRPHAERTAEALGITGEFEDIFDIVAADLLPKPNLATYELFVQRTGISPVRAAMFEDLPKNLHAPHKLGMQTVLIVPPGTRDVFREDWDLEADGTKHVDFMTEDLAGFLKAVGGALRNFDAH